VASGRPPRPPVSWPGLYDSADEFEDEEIQDLLSSVELDFDSDGLEMEVEDQPRPLVFAVPLPPISARRPAPTDQLGSPTAGATKFEPGRVLVGQVKDR
jgi:hypothetical protein